MIFSLSFFFFFTLKEAIILHVEAGWFGDEADALTVTFMASAMGKREEKKWPNQMKLTLILTAAISCCCNGFILTRHFSVDFLLW